jgi:hypothetical protein
MATMLNDHWQTQNVVSNLELDNNLFDDDDQHNSETDQTTSTQQKQKDSKNRRKRNKKKKPQKSANNAEDQSNKENNSETIDDKDQDIQIEIELVPEEIKLDKNYEEFSKVFDHFKVKRSQANHFTLQILTNYYLN